MLGYQGDRSAPPSPSTDLLVMALSFMAVVWATPVGFKGGGMAKKSWRVLRLALGGRLGHHVMMSVPPPLPLPRPHNDGGQPPFAITAITRAFTSMHAVRGSPLPLLF